MVESMVRQISKPAGKRPWLGTFNDNSFTNDWVDTDTFIRNVPRILPGYYAKGHCGWSPEIAQAFRNNHIALIFIYRDMRDVAVSLTHHARSLGNDRLTHPDKQHFAEMTFERALQTVIAGDDRFPGVYDRWALYAPWLLEDWVLKLRYDDVQRNAYDTAVLIIRYAYGYTARSRNNTIRMSEKDVQETAMRMIGALARKDTGTFRRGKSGTWREVWTHDVAATFDRCERQFVAQMEQQLAQRMAA